MGYRAKGSEVRDFRVTLSPGDYCHLDHEPRPPSLNKKQRFILQANGAWSVKCVAPTWGSKGLLRVFGGYRFTLHPPPIRCCASHPCTWEVCKPSLYTYIATTCHAGHEAPMFMPFLPPKNLHFLKDLYTEIRIRNPNEGGPDALQELEGLKAGRQPSPKCGTILLYVAIPSYRLMIRPCLCKDLRFGRLFSGQVEAL